jgi:hypothetical protein
MITCRRNPIFLEPYYYPYPRSTYDNRGYRLHYDEPSPFRGIH